MLPQVLSGTWRFWPAAYESQAISDIMMDDNVLWIGTSFGVVRLDLQTRVHTLIKHPGAVYQILSSADGLIVGAKFDEYWYFDGQTWTQTRFKGSDELWSEEFVGVDVNGDLWLQAIVVAARSYRTLRFSGHIPPHAEQWVSVEEVLSNEHEPLDCSWWRVYHSSTFTYRSPEECQRLVKAQAVMNQQQVYGPFAADADGTVWWANDTTLYHLAADGSTLAHFPVSETHRLIADPSHGVWLASQEGLFFADGKTIEPISIGLEKYTLYPTENVAIDTSGKVWATSTHGLQQLDTNTQRWSLVDDARLNGMLSKTNLRGLAAAPDGGVWIATEQDVLIHYADKVITTSPVADSRCGLRSLSVDPAGQVWFSSVNCGSVQFDPATKVWHYQRPSSNTSYIDVVCQSIGLDGSVYSVDVKGDLSVYSSLTRTWRFIARIDDPLGASIAADNQGGVWVSQSGGVRHYPDGTMLMIAPEVTGFPSYRIFADQQSNLWIATSDKLYLYDGQGIKLVASPPISPVSAMTVAPDGHLWFVGGQGIAVYDPKGNQP